MLQHKIALPVNATESSVYDLCNISADAYLRETDVAFAGGSIVEGLGNRFSDVDVHVITDRYRLSEEIDVARHYRVLTPSRSIVKEGDTGQEIFLIHTLIPGTQIKVDIEYRTYEGLDALVDRLHEVFDYAVNSPLLLTKDIDHREKAFLNRLFTGITLHNEDRLADIRKAIGKDRFLYLLYRWKASDFSVLIDLIGAYEQDELERACDLARERLIAEFQAFVHLAGCTNFNRKWLLSYARKVSIDPGLLARFERLFLLDGYDLRQNPRKYVRDTVDFVDDVMFASEAYLTGSQIYPRKEAVLSAIDATLEGVDDAYAHSEAEYRKKAYGVAGKPTWRQFEQP